MKKTQLLTPEDQEIKERIQLRAMDRAIEKYSTTLYACPECKLSFVMRSMKVHLKRTHKMTLKNIDKIVCKLFYDEQQWRLQNE